MKFYDVEHLARTIKGDAYYEEIRLLKDDIEFFSTYIRRNRKSNFSFILIPCQQSTYTAFKDIFEAYGLSNSNIDNAYAEYLNHDFKLNLLDYVECFVGCSHGVAGTKKMLYDMINK